MTLEELQAIAMGVDVGDPLPPLPFEALGEDLELRLAPVANALFRLNALHEAIFSLCESFKKWIRQLAKRLLADSLASSASAPPEGPEAARPKTALAQLKELSIERFEGIFFSPTAPISPICRTPLFPDLTFFFNRTLRRRHGHRVRTDAHDPPPGSPRPRGARQGARRRVRRRLALSRHLQGAGRRAVGEHGTFFSLSRPPTHFSHMSHPTFAISLTFYSFFFKEMGPTHFSYISHPTFPISHLFILVFR